MKNRILIKRKAYLKRWGSHWVSIKTQKTDKETIKGCAINCGLDALDTDRGIMEKANARGLL